MWGGDKKAGAEADLEYARVKAMLRSLNLAVRRAEAALSERCCCMHGSRACTSCCPLPQRPLNCAPPSGLQQYEKNVRKGQLNDQTIGLWDTSALQVGGGTSGAAGRGPLPGVLLLLPGSAV